jgi:hypothetical protein
MNDDIKAYLIHCYLYYKLDTCVISDGEFDALCKRLLDSGVEHPLVSKGDLEAGTGYSIVEYPSSIVEEAKGMLEDVPELVSMPAEETFAIAFTYTEMETWVLLAMYIDYGYHRLYDKRETIHAELQRRWSEGIHRTTFLQYFKDHNHGPERFKLS